MSSGATPGIAGIFGIVLLVLGVSVVITLTTECFAHWPFVLGGIVVGLWAVQSINK